MPSKVLKEKEKQEKLLKGYDGPSRLIRFAILFFPQQFPTATIIVHRCPQQPTLIDHQER